MSFEVCVESAEVSFDQCTAYADRGHRECEEWRSRCCDWWPCNWFCELISWFCFAWVWVSNFVCVAWKSITLLVCLVWAVVEVLLAPLGALIELILSIPVIGRFIDLILNTLTEAAWRVMKVPDMVASLTGVDSTLTVRLVVFVVRFSGGYPRGTLTGAEITRENIETAVNAAHMIWLNAANIQLQLERIEFLSDDAPREAAMVACGDEIFSETMGLAGSYYKLIAARNAPLKSVGRLTGLGSSIVIVYVHDITNALGCAMGPFNDFLVIKGDVTPCVSHEVLAHEIGHKLGLLHHGINPNIMSVCDPTSTVARTELEVWQRLWARGSKYASYI